MTHSFASIGTIKTCFTEKFGVPRQALMAMEAKGVIKLNADPQFAAALHQLSGFSHIWVVFVFHQSLGRPWRARIEPPRPDGPKTVGVFASRSPHRPNPIGMSVLRLDRIDFEAQGGIEIHVSGVDLLDGTPVLDIKPYLPYADSLPHATSGWANEELQRYPVEFSPESLETLAGEPRLKELLEELVSWDPRPTSQRSAMPLRDGANEGKTFRFRLLGFDVEWQIVNGNPKVLRLYPMRDGAGSGS
ncbi:MAG: tRNA (N6-threonylcarbamoyladenosine(37)-N6)-methyltransferase TrmO [Bdellovibrionota bacterium]